jgi:hypothetical protein
MQAPIGPLSTALETARQQLASCPSFQALVAATDQPTAAGRIYLAGLPPPANREEYSPAEWESSLRPLAVLYTSSRQGYGRSRTGLYAWRENGRLFCEIEVTVPETWTPPEGGPALMLWDYPEQSDRWILNQLGPVIEDFCNLGGTPGNLDVQSVEVVMGPSREKPEEEPGSGFYYWVLLEILYGATE